MADSKRFVQHSKYALEEAPLQVYSSGLLFAPEESIVRKTFQEKVPGWITHRAKMDETWDQALYDFADHSGGIDSIKFCKNGQRIASLDFSGILIVWDVETGVTFWKTDGIMCIDVCTAQEPCLLAGVDREGNIHLWPGMERRSKRCLVGQSAPEAAMIESVVFSPDGNYLASIGENNVLMVWDLKDNGRGERLPKAELPGNVKIERYWKLNLSTISNEGHYIAAWTVLWVRPGRYRYGIVTWFKRYGGEWAFHHYLNHGAGGVADMTLVGTSLVWLGTHPAKLGIWDIRRKIIRKEITLKSCKPSGQRLVCLPDSNQVVAPDENDLLRRFDLNKSGDEIQGQSFEGSNGVDDCTVSANGKTLAGVFFRSPSGAGFCLWDTDSGKRVALSTQGLGPAYPFSLSPDGRTLATSSIVHSDSSIRVFDCGLLRQQELERERKQQRPSVGRGSRAQVDTGSAEVSPDGRFVAIPASVEGEVGTLAVYLDMHDTDGETTNQGKGGHTSRTGLSGSFRVELSPQDVVGSALFSPSSDRFAVISLVKHDQSNESERYNDRIRLRVWDLEDDRWRLHKDVIIWKKQSTPFVERATFSENSALLSVVSEPNHEQATTVAVFELDSDKDPLPCHSHSLGEKRSRYDGYSSIHALDPHLSESFQLARKEEYMEASGISVYKTYIMTYGRKETPPKLVASLEHGSKIPMSAALGLNQQTVAVLYKGNVFRLFDLTDKSCPKQRVSFRIRPPLISDSPVLTLCSQSRCIRFSRNSHFMLPSQLKSDQSCPCRLICISQPSGTPWFLWQGKPFIRLPYPPDASTNILVRGRTVLLICLGEPRVRWFKLDEALWDRLREQPIHDSAIRITLMSQEEDISEEENRTHNYDSTYIPESTDEWEATDECETTDEGKTTDEGETIDEGETTGEE